MAAATLIIDCSEKICSIYCPRWCLTALSPPPQPPGLGSTTTVPPVIIALIVLLVAVFVTISCYGYVCIYLGRRRAPQDDAEAPPSEGQASEYGLDDFVIKSITVFQFRKSDKLVEGTECSVCLCDFEEGENLRLLPKCCHAFHPQCIDTWLRSNSSCPLCRAGVNPYSPVNPNSQSSAAINVSSLEVRRNQSEFVVMVEDDTRQVMEVSTCDDQPKDSEEGQFRRSISSLGSFSSEGRLLVADIARSDGYGVRRSYSTASFDTTLHDRA